MKKGRRRKSDRRSNRSTQSTSQSPGSDCETQVGAHENNAWKFSVLALLVICCLGSAIYSNSLDGEFVFDGIRNISLNRHITHVTELDWQLLYDAATKSPSPRPVANFSLALNHYFGGTDVTGYHLVNIVIHLICGVLVYFLALLTLRLYFGNEPLESPVSDRTIEWMALLAACLFIAHPLQTQAVTYIVQRMTCMATMFYLLAVLLYLQGRLISHGRRRWLLWTGCLLCWLLALGSKQIAATLPLVMVLYEWYFFQDLSREWFKRSFKYLVVPLVVVVLIALLWLGASPWERILAGYDRRDFTLTERLLTQPRVIVYYLSLILLPLPSRLNLLHHFSTSHSLLEPITTLFSLLTIAVLAGLAVYLARRQRLLSFCILWFLLHLVIESSVIALEMAFEHRLYLPLFAFALAVPYAGYRLLSQRAVLAGVVGTVVILSLAAGTYVRNQVWQDEIVFWNDVIAKNPLSHRAHDKLGIALEKHGKTSEAFEHYRQALRIKPDSAEAHNNLGFALQKQGNLPEAIKHFRQSLEIQPNNTRALLNLGVALAAQENVEEAIEHFREVVQIKPDLAIGHSNLALALTKQGRFDEAIQHFREAVRLGLNNHGIHYDFGNALLRQGKNKEAIRHYREVLRINPDFAEGYSNLGVALTGQGKITEAIKQFHRALRIKPDYVQANVNLAIALDMLAAVRAESGRYNEAIKLALKGIEAATAARNEELARELRQQVAAYQQAIYAQKPEK